MTRAPVFAIVTGAISLLLLVPQAHARGTRGRGTSGQSKAAVSKITGKTKSTALKGRFLRLRALLSRSRLRASTAVKSRIGSFKRLTRATWQKLRRLKARAPLGTPGKVKPRACKGGSCGVKARKVCSPRTAVAKRTSSVRVVARVRPLSSKAYRSSSRLALAGMRGRERFQAARLLMSRRVRRSPAAQHTVLAYLQLRGVRGKGGRDLPFSIKEIRTMVSSKRWTSQRLANLALVLRQAKAIAKRDKISPKQAFDKALRANGIYRRYYHSVCS